MPQIYKKNTHKYMICHKAGCSQVCYQNWMNCQTDKLSSAAVVLKKLLLPNLEISTVTGMANKHMPKKKNKENSQYLSVLLFYKQYLSAYAA